MTHKIFEKLWIFVLAICSIVFVYSLITKGFGEAYIWLIWMIFSLLFYFRRRKIRMDLSKDK